jgi:exonuclease III
MVGGSPTQTPHQANINHNNTQRDIPMPKKKKKMRANILIATMNMKGHASPQLGNGEISKWSTIQHVMQEKKIGILGIQETHLLPEHETQIDALYSQRLKIINSRDPHCPGNSVGVAFIINKEIFNPEDLTTTEIIPGRVLVIRTKWHNNTNLTIANIYAPNTHSQHEEFWNLIMRTWQEKRLLNPDFIMGDFNITEDALDRAPARPENEQALDALRDLRFQLDVQDTWRMNHPSSRLFTFYSNNNMYS